MATTPVRFIERVGDASTLLESQRGIDTDADSTTGQRLSHYKDAYGVVHKQANIVEPASFTDLEVTGDISGDFIDDMLGDIAQNASDIAGTIPLIEGYVDSAVSEVTLDDVVLNGDGQLNQTINNTWGYVEKSNRAVLQRDVPTFDQLRRRSKPREVLGISNVASLPAAASCGDAYLVSPDDAGHANEIAERIVSDTYPSATIVADAPSEIRSIVDCPEIDTIFFLGASASCGRSRDGGRTIETIVVGTGATYISSAWSPSRREMWAASTDGYIVKTLDGGNSFSVVADMAASSGGIVCGGTEQDIFAGAFTDGTSTVVYADTPETPWSLVATITGSYLPRDMAWDPIRKNFIFTCALGDTASVVMSEDFATVNVYPGSAVNSMTYIPWLKKVGGPRNRSFAMSADGETYEDSTLPGAFDFDEIAVDIRNQLIVLASQDLGTTTLTVSHDGTEGSWTTIDMPTDLRIRAIAFVRGCLNIGTINAGYYLVRSVCEMDWIYHLPQGGQRVFQQDLSRDRFFDGATWTNDLHAVSEFTTSIATGTSTENFAEESSVVLDELDVAMSDGVLFVGTAGYGNKQIVARVPTVLMFDAFENGTTIVDVDNLSGDWGVDAIALSVENGATDGTVSFKVSVSKINVLFGFDVNWIVKFIGPVTPKAEPLPTVSVASYEGAEQAVVAGDYIYAGSYQYVQKILLTTMTEVDTLDLSATLLSEINDIRHDGTTLWAREGYSLDILEIDISDMTITRQYRAFGYGTPTAMDIDDTYLYCLTDNGAATRFFKFTKGNTTAVVAADLAADYGTVRSLVIVGDSLFFTSSTNSKLYRATKVDGVVTHNIGSNGSGDDQFDSPRDLKYVNGELWILDYNNNRIVRRTADTSMTYIGELAVDSTTSGFDYHPIFGVLVETRRVSSTGTIYRTYRQV